MMTDLWMPRLSEYLDGDLPDDQRAALERHVAGCAECATTLDELRRVVARAQGLEDREPSTDLWPGIARRIAEADAGVVPIERQRAMSRRLLVSWPQLAAAAVFLVALSGGTTWLVQSRLARSAATEQPALAARTRVQNARLQVANRGYDAAIADLERTLDEQRGQLDTATVRVIERNLRLIDQAIAQAQQALATDPSSVYLNTHLADAKRRKLDLLRRVTAIPTVQS